MADLRQVFAATISPDANIRKQAEAQLLVSCKSSGHGIAVLQLIATNNPADDAIRQAAAVHFKNLVKTDWYMPGEDVDQEIREQINELRKGAVFTPQDRETIKENLVQLMCSVPSLIQSQVSETIGLIAASDFPNQWTNLLPHLVQRFADPDLAIVNGCLNTVDTICKSFRHKQRSDELYADILYTLPLVQQPLLTMFVQMGQSIQDHVNNKEQLVLRFETMRLIARIFYSLVYQDLPEFFEDHMKDWMVEFAKYLTYTNPLLVDNDEEDEPSPIDKLQAAIIMNLQCFSDKDEEPFEPFLPDFTKSVWNLLVGLSQHPKHDVLATTSIKFLSSLIRKPIRRALFNDESTLDQIVSRIVMPNVTVRPDDEERFEDNPQEYILTEIEGSDSESRRTCALRLLRDMCQQFEPETTAICTRNINEMLAAFAADQTKWAAKDAAIHLMLGIAIRTESYLGVSQLNENVDILQFFTTNIFPELQDAVHTNRPMVKATALKFVSTFRKQFTREQLVALLPVLTAHLASPSVVVHTLAAYCIERVLMVKDTNNATFKVLQEDLRPHLESLFGGLFAVVDNAALNENEHLMKCIMRTLSRAGPDMIPVVGVFLNRLSTVLGIVCKHPRNPRYNHYLFESIAALVQNVCKDDPSQTIMLEGILFPPFQSVLTLDILECTPYVFQVLAQLLEYRPAGTGLGDAYGSLLPPLLTPSLWESKGNTPGMVRLLEAYLKQAAAEIAQGGHLAPMLGIFQKLLATKSTEKSAFALVSAITTYAPQQALGQYLGTIFQLICKAAQGRTKSRGISVTYFGLFAALYGGQVLLDTLNSLGPGTGMSALVSLWIPNVSDSFNTKIGAKIQAIGLTKVLCETPALLADDNGKTIWAQTLGSIVTILTSQTLSRTEVYDNDDADIEIGYDATFCKLNLAKKTEHDPFPNQNPTDVFATGLQTLSNAHPGIVGPIIEKLRSDEKVFAGFQGLVQQTKMNIA